MTAAGEVNRVTSSGVYTILMADKPYPPFDHSRRIAEIWVEAWNRRDADRLADLFAEDAEFVNVTGLWWHDREAIRRAHDYGLRTIFDQSPINQLAYAPPAANTSTPAVAPRSSVA